MKFRELIEPGTKIEFIGRRKLLLGISALLMVLSLLMLPINAALRGSMLNWTIDFKGGTEIILTVDDPKAGAGGVRGALGDAGYGGADVSAFAVEKAGKKLNGYLVRLPEFGAVSPAEAARVADAFTASFADRGITKAKWLGDEFGIRSRKALTRDEVTKFLAEQKLEAKPAPAGETAFGKKEAGLTDLDTTYVYDVATFGLDRMVERALEAKIGPVSIEQVAGVGAKAGAELRNDAMRSLLYAIALIMLYIAFRFDFRYGPGTVAALLHDAIVVLGVFAVFWVEFSLTTVAAILTVIGYSMNDTVVVFDRIRENESKLKDKKLDRVINISINETLSRTFLTSLTTLSVTICMWAFGTGVVENFALAMTIGIVVGTYSSIFIAAPILLVLDEKYFSKRTVVDRRKRLSQTTPEPIET